ncbi:hypothetical protein F5884DRAFT_852675 [Xylogone sp. PMI_703]|nr:hypothetical protein F5884DRAFT_852675 [Xylogone sp. PMI_703]
MGVQNDRIARMVEGEADEPLHYSAFVGPGDIICEGSDAEQSPETIRRKHRRYERYASLYLEGKLPIIQSASLRGPLDKESGWINPWQSQPKRNIRGKEGMKRKNDTQSSLGMTSFNSSTRLNSSRSDGFQTASSKVGKEVKSKEKMRDHDDTGSSQKRDKRATIAGQLVESAETTSEGNSITNVKSRETSKRASELSWLKGARNYKRPRWDSTPASTPTPLPSVQVNRSPNECQAAENMIRHSQATDMPLPRVTDTSGKDRTEPRDNQISSSLPHRQLGSEVGIADYQSQTGSQEPSVSPTDELPCRSSIILKRAASTDRQDPFIIHELNTQVDSFSGVGSHICSSSNGESNTRASLKLHSDPDYPKTSTRTTRISMGCDGENSLMTLFEPSSGGLGGFHYKQRRRKSNLPTLPDMISRRNLDLDPYKQTPQSKRMEPHSPSRTLGSPFKSQTGDGDNEQCVEEQPEAENLPDWKQRAEVLQHDIEMQTQDEEDYNPALHHDDLKSLGNAPCSSCDMVNDNSNSATLRLSDNSRGASIDHKEGELDISRSPPGSLEISQPDVIKASSQHDKSELPGKPPTLGSPLKLKPIFSSKNLQIQSPWALEKFTPLPITYDDGSNKPSSEDEQDDTDDITFVEVTDQDTLNKSQVTNSQGSDRFMTPVEDNIKPFNEFITPLPAEIQGPTTLTQMLELETTHNPWTETTKATSSKKCRKRVSFNFISEDEDNEPQSSVPSKKLIGSPPPPIHSLRDLSQGDAHDDGSSSFENHFRAASRYISTKIGSSSQRSPRVDAMAEAFISADIPTSRPRDHSTSENIIHSPREALAEHQSTLNSSKENFGNSYLSTDKSSLRKTSTIMEEMDVNTLIGEIGDFLQEWDVETEVKNVVRLSQSKDSSQTTLPLRRGLLSAPES